VLAPLKAASDLPTQGRARAGSVSSRLSTVFRRTASKSATPTPSLPAVVSTAASGSPSVPRHAAVVDNLKSQGRSRLASMPVRPQFKVTELAAAGKQVDLETERLPLKALAARALSSWRPRRRRRHRRRHSSSEQLAIEPISSARRSWQASVREIFGALKFECCSLSARGDCVLNVSLCVVSFACSD
jgi:hypothetical protein